jgi:4-hydroxybenzoyl-CoA thioesterase
VDARPAQLATERFILRRRVKWGECDPAGVVFTPRFSDYVVEAHLAFFEQVFGAPTYEFLKPMGLALPAKAISIEFKHSLWPDQSFDMSVQVAAIRTRTYDLAVVGTTLDGLDSFIANLTLICLNRVMRKSEPLPDLICRKLQAIRDSSPPVHDVDVAPGGSPEG